MDRREIWRRTAAWRDGSKKNEYWRVLEAVSKLLEKLEVSKFKGTRLVFVQSPKANGRVVHAFDRFAGLDSCNDHEFQVSLRESGWDYQARESFIHRVTLATKDPECQRVVMECVVCRGERVHMILLLYDKAGRTAMFLDPHGRHTELYDIRSVAARSLKQLFGVEARDAYFALHDNIQRELPHTHGLCTLYSKLMMIRIGHHFARGGTLDGMHVALNDPPGSDSLRELDVVVGAAYHPEVSSTLQCAPIIRAFAKDSDTYPCLVLGPEDNIDPFRDRFDRGSDSYVTISHDTADDFCDTVHRISEAYGIQPHKVEAAMWLITMYAHEFDMREPEHASVIMQTYRVPVRVAYTLMASMDYAGQSGYRVMHVLQIARQL